MLTSSFRSVGFNFVLSIRRYRSAKERQSDFYWISFCDSLFLSPWRGRRTTHRVRWHTTASIENKEKQLFSYWLDFICIKFLADTCLSCQFDNIGATPWIYWGGSQLWSYSSWTLSLRVATIEMSWILTEGDMYSIQQWHAASRYFLPVLCEVSLH